MIHSNITFLKKMEKLREELKSRGFSEKTISLYIYFNSKFLDFCKKKYEEINSDDVNNYLTFLAEKKSYSTILVAYSALKFFYDSVLRKNFFSSVNIPKKEKKHDLLTEEEIKKLVDSATTEKSKLIIKMLCFLKASELVTLRKSDIDPEKGIVKGKASVPKDLISQFREIEDEYIFKGRKGIMCVRNIQKILSRAAKKAGLQKRVTSFILRNSSKNINQEEIFE